MIFGIGYLNLQIYTQPQARGKSELVPYWHVETDSIKIERVVPLYPYSRDQARLTKILRTPTLPDPHLLTEAG